MLPWCQSAWLSSRCDGSSSSRRPPPSTTVDVFAAVARLDVASVDGEAGRVRSPAVGEREGARGFDVRFITPPQQRSRLRRRRRRAAELGAFAVAQRGRHALEGGVGAGAGQVGRQADGGGGRGGGVRGSDGGGASRRAEAGGVPIIDLVGSKAVVRSGDEDDHHQAETPRVAETEAAEGGALAGLPPPPPLALLHLERLELPQRARRFFLHRKPLRLAPAPRRRRRRRRPATRRR